MHHVQWMYIRCQPDIHTFDLNNTKRERDAKYSVSTLKCCIVSCRSWFWTLFRCSHCCHILTWTTEGKNTWHEPHGHSVQQRNQNARNLEINEQLRQILTWGLRAEGKHLHSSSVNISGLTRKWSGPWCVNVMRGLKGHTGGAVGLPRPHICDALTLKQPLHSLCAPSICRHRAGKSHRITVLMFRPWWRYYKSNHLRDYCDVSVFYSHKMKTL